MAKKEIQRREFVRLSAAFPALAIAPSMVMFQQSSQISEEWNPRWIDIDVVEQALTAADKLLPFIQSGQVHPILDQMLAVHLTLLKEFRSAGSDNLVEYAMMHAAALESGSLLDGLEPDSALYQIIERGLAYDLADFMTQPPENWMKFHNSTIAGFWDLTLKHHPELEPTLFPSLRADMRPTEERPWRRYAGSLPTDVIGGEPERGGYSTATMCWYLKAGLWYAGWVAWPLVNGGYLSPYSVAARVTFALATGTVMAACP